VKPNFVKKSTGEMKKWVFVVGLRSRRDGVESSADAGQELVLVDALEWSLRLFLVQASASIRSLAAELHVGWPGSVGRDLRQSKVAVHSAVAWLEDAVGEEQLNVEILGHDAVCPSADKAASLLKQLLQVVRGLLGRSAVLVSAQVECAHLEIAAELDVLVGEEIGAY
jgi:hypothetical protein